MSQLNVAILEGHLTADPEARYTPNGKLVVSFTVASNDIWKDAAGEKQERANFVPVTVWGKLAETCKQYLAKGRHVLVEGRIQVDRINGEGEEKARYYTKVVANTVRFLGAPKNGDAPDGDPTGSEEEIPF